LFKKGVLVQMSLKTVKRLASRIEGCGENRVKVLDAKKAQGALTADDVRSLIKEKVLVIKDLRGVGRGKARATQAKRRKGRKRREGSIKGSPNARFDSKSRWLRIVRAQRRLLKHFKPMLVSGAYRKLYRMVKGSAFPDKRRMLDYIKANNLAGEKIK